VTDDEILTVKANAATAYAALDKLLEIAPSRVRAAAFETATRVRDEARRRIRRRTGRTAAGIVVRELENGAGYMVVAEGAPGQPQTNRGAPAVPVWLEFGATSMRFGPKPFLLVAGKLEEQAHEGRITEALESAIADAGLGE
jgi:Bacteriophage HK97-gp10, putative tail-component